MSRAAEATAPTAKQVLSPNLLRNLKATGSLVEIADDVTKGGEKGLWLRMTPAGTRSWVVRMRDTNGKTRRFVVGAYPALGLADARDAAKKLKNEVRHQGRDPVQEGRERRARFKVQGDGTLEGLVGAYFDKGRGGRGEKLRTADEQKARILSVFEKLKEKSLPSLTPDDLRQAVKAYPSESVAGAAAAYLKAVLRRLGDDDAHLLALASKLKRPAPIGEASRHLTTTEVTNLLRALPPVGESAYADAVRMYLWTGARRSEVAGMRWQELNEAAGEWTVPKDRMKSTRGDAARKPHMRKLPHQALALLEARKAAATPAGSSAPRGEALVFPSRGGGEIDNWDRWLKDLQEKAGVARFSLHDLRRTAATLARSLGTSTDTIDKGMLAHTPPKLERIYMRGGLEDEAGQAMQKLADHYAVLAAPNVVQLKRA